MKKILKKVGPFTAKARRDRFGTLVNSIISQQISVAAARTIRGRLVEAIEPDPITPDSILQFSLDELRAIGISRQKASYVLDLADKVKTNQVDLKSIHKKEDEGAIEELVQVKGVGRWTAQMFIMFSLGRLNVLPVDDLGIKNAITKEYELKALPDAKKMTQIAESWRPYATIACWYLWQSLEVE